MNAETDSVNSFTDCFPLQPTPYTYIEPWRKRDNLNNEVGPTDVFKACHKNKTYEEHSR